MVTQNRTFLDAKERLLRLPEVRARTGMGTTTVYRRMTEGTFPRPVEIGGGRVAWPETQIDAWIAAQIAASSAKSPTSDEAGPKEAPHAAPKTRARSALKPRAAKATAEGAGKRRTSIPDTTPAA